MLIAAASLAAAAAASSVPVEMAENLPLRDMRSGSVATRDARPLLPLIVDAARADAALLAGVQPDSVTLIRSESVTWSDGSIGCPRPGGMYTQALVPGWRIHLDVSGRALIYHASQQGHWVWCRASGLQLHPGGPVTR